MADEPQQAPESGAGGEGDAKAAPEPSGGVRGLLTTYLPLIVAVVVMPLLAWATIEFKSKKTKAGSAAAPHDSEEEASSAHGAAPEESSHEAADSGHGSGSDAAGATRKVDTGLLTIPVPLTRDPVMFSRRDVKVSQNDFDKIVILDVKGEARDLARADKIVVNIAGTDGTRFAVARFLVSGPNMQLVQAINEKKEMLLDAATGALSGHTLDEINKPGFRGVLRAELLTLFNQKLYPYPNLIQDVIITEFVIQ